MTVEIQGIAVLADVGGTNTRVALSRDGVVDASSIAKFRNAEFESLDRVLGRYIQSSGTLPNSAAIAVAGPVRDGRGELTNLSWSFDENGLSDQISVPNVHILNDLQAQGYGLGSLTEDAISTVVRGTGHPRGDQTQIVVGVGTGFNAAPVHNGNDTQLVVASECGHVSLPQENEEHRRLARWFEEHHGFASVEDALSGRGLEALYAFYCDDKNCQMSGADIFAAEKTGGDRHASNAIRLFVQLLGAAIGDLALTHLPFGGVYLIGGMARAVVPYFQTYEFEKSLCAKGRFKYLMQEFSVHIVEDDFAALSGCASYLTKKAFV